MLPVSLSKVKYCVHVGLGFKRFSLFRLLWEMIQLVHSISIRFELDFETNASPLFISCLWNNLLNFPCVKRTRIRIQATPLMQIIAHLTKHFRFYTLLQSARKESHIPKRDIYSHIYLTTKSNLPVENGPLILQPSTCFFFKKSQQLKF